MIVSKTFEVIFNRDMAIKDEIDLDYRLSNFGFNSHIFSERKLTVSPDDKLITEITVRDFVIMISTIVEPETIHTIRETTEYEPRFN
jgi:hypothetical protein